MNAPVKTAPARDRYIPIVRHHLPGCSDEETTVRCALLFFRDTAMSKARACSDEAHGILTEVQRIASHHAFRSMPIGELKALRYNLSRLIMAASGLEMMVYRLENPNAGGTDGGE